MTAPHPNGDMALELERLRTALNDALVDNRRKTQVLRDQITRLEWVNKEEHATIACLTGHIVLLAAALELADKALPDRLKTTHERIIAEAREAVA